MPSRYRSGATTFAYEHRAFAARPDAGRIVAGAALGAAAALAVWAAALPAIVRVWGHGLAALNDALGRPARVVMALDHWGPYPVGIPYLDLPTVLPSPALLAVTAAVTVALWLATALLPETLRPGAYLARAVLLVQASAVLYFAVWPGAFDYTLGGYLQGMTATGLAIGAATPVVLGLTYYVQDIAPARKLALTAVAMGYTAILVPVQYAVHGLLIAHASVLFLPAVYLFLGVPLHVFALIALYAWGMSWPGREPALGTPIPSLDP